MRQRHLYGLAATLTALGLAVFLYKVWALGFPVRPEASVTVWEVQARVTFDALGGPVKATLQLPDEPPGYLLLDETFVSRGYGRSILGGAGRRTQWSKRHAAGPQTVYYRTLAQADVTQRGRRAAPEPPPVPRLSEPHRTAVMTLVDEIERQSADAQTFAHQVIQRLNDRGLAEPLRLLATRGGRTQRPHEVAVTLLAAAGIPSRVVHAVALEDRRRATIEPWLEVFTGEDWIQLDPRSGERRLPGDLLIWWRGQAPLLTLSGAEGGRVQLSVQKVRADALGAAERRAELRGSKLVELSLLALPVHLQAVYSVLLLVPLGALIIVGLRNVVGIRTIGTFMPVLVALGFRETRLLAGIVLFALVVASGLVIRSYLERLRLLLVPRLAAVLIVVVLLMVVISVLSHRLGIETGLSVALFPMVILAMAIEHMSIVWEERGAAEAIRLGLGTLVVAVLAYLVMSLALLEHLMVLFPELLLVVLAATLLLGRYRGYRLTELMRFRGFRRGGA